MAHPPEQGPLSYRDAGVDIDAGNRLVARIKTVAARTHRAEVIGGLGGFGGLFKARFTHLAEPILVAGADGVGTKLLLACQAQALYGTQPLRTVGIDLVAMCVNDVLVQGAEPLFFLDYLATGKLEVERAVKIIEGIGEGCRLSGAALLGGETAEMPGLYNPGDVDLAGFAVGVVDRTRLLDGTQAKLGDQVVGLASSGPHANGYSLIRKVLARSHVSLTEPVGETTLGEALLAPTRIYVKALLELLTEGHIHAAAHITGGGLTENLPRVLPVGCKAVIDLKTWPRPPIFTWLKAQGGIAEAELRRTFNCGIGMAVIVPETIVSRVLEHAQADHINAWVIGGIEPTDQAPWVQYVK